jgi:peptidoglycan/LPS O-acetylase OafA/YrhL
MRSNSNRLQGLDGVRGLAICSVLIYHYFAIGFHFAPGSASAYAQKLLGLSWAGVDLFFVLSGFLIGGILMDHRDAKNYFAIFYLRRAARILPPYLLLLAGWFLIVSANVLTGESKEWLLAGCPPLWMCLLFVQNIWMGLVGEHGGNWLGVTWSLAIEEQAYLLLPLLARFLTPKWFVGVIAGMILSAPLFRLEAMSHHDLGTYVWPHCRWDGIAFGVFGAWLVRRNSFEEWRIALCRRWFPCLAVCLSGVILLTLLNVSIASFGMSLAGHTWLAASSLMLILLGIRPPAGVVETVLTHPFLVWMGTISYGAYLYHQPVSGLVHGFFRAKAPAVHDMSDLMVTLIALTGTLLLAHFSWRFMEAPLLKLARRRKYEDNSGLS